MTILARHGKCKGIVKPKGCISFQKTRMPLSQVVPMEPQELGVSNLAACASKCSLQKQMHGTQIFYWSLPVIPWTIILGPLSCTVMYIDANDGKCVFGTVNPVAHAGGDLIEVYRDLGEICVAIFLHCQLTTPLQSYQTGPFLLDLWPPKTGYSAFWTGQSNEAMPSKRAALPRGWGQL